MEVRYLGSAGQSDVSDCNGVIMIRKDKVICVNMVVAYKQDLMHTIVLSSADISCTHYIARVQVYTLWCVCVLCVQVYTLCCVVVCTGVHFVIHAPVT